MSDKDPKAISAAELKALAEAFTKVTAPGGGKNAKPVIESAAAMAAAAARIMKGQ